MVTLFSFKFEGPIFMSGGDNMIAPLGIIGLNLYICALYFNTFIAFHSYFIHVV
jgi:hypothetical protein